MNKREGIKWHSRNTYGNAFKDNGLYGTIEKGVLKLTPDSQTVLRRYNLR